MRVCVVGSGGREHALARALARTADRVVVAPGNPGMADPALGIECTERPPRAVEADLWVIGPEAPLVDGLADRLRADGRPVLGPGADGARLEGSKAWMKQLLVDARVPTARYGAFTVEQETAALDLLGSFEPPYVVKTDGLAAGKGVLVTDDLDEAEADVRAKLAGTSFGAAGTTVVIEEGLSGPELSVLAICDGKRAVPLAPARDHKRLGDGDDGPNTGGMGAYSPVPTVDDRVVDAVMDEAVEPTLAALRRQGVDYRGVLYAGLMLTADGVRILEYNVRFGDPEAQVVLPRLDTDLTGLLHEAATGRLRTDPKSTSDAAVTVVMASEGYPEAPRTGDVIEGLAAAAAHPGASVCFAGVASEADGPLADDGRPRLVTAGGRVLAVTGMGADLAAARDRAYGAAQAISFPGMQMRSDIARDRTG